MNLNLIVGTRDLGRTRFAVSPLHNLIIGVWGHRPPQARQRWWRSARRNAPHTAAPLLELINAHPWYVPDFLTPAAPGTPTSTPGSRRSPITEELDALRAVTDAEIRADLQCHSDLPGLPRSVLQLRDGGTRQLARIADASHALFRACLAEDWPDIQRHLQADIAHRATQIATLGSGPVLGGLNPRLRWRDDTTLTVTLGDCAGHKSPDHTTINLSGNGLLLKPSPFVAPGMIAITGSVTAQHQAVIAYPAITPAPPAGRDHDTLATLIGRGRARALRAIQGTVTTTELAHRLGIGVPTASQHTTALRAAGLVATHRNGRSVQHTLTNLGTHLLTGNPPPRDRDSG